MKKVGAKKPPLHSSLLSLVPPERPPVQTGHEGGDSSSEAAPSQPSLPDLTAPDQPSEEVFGTEDDDPDLAVPQKEGPPESPQPCPSSSGEPPPSPLAEEGAAAEAGSEESPGKSPSKKKKKFRTPSFLKKSKKKSDP